MHQWMTDACRRMVSRNPRTKVHEMRGITVDWSDPYNAAKFRRARSNKNFLHPAIFWRPRGTSSAMAWMYSKGRTTNVPSFVPFWRPAYEISPAELRWFRPECDRQTDRNSKRLSPHSMRWQQWKTKLEAKDVLPNINRTPFLSLVTCTVDFWPWRPNLSERGSKHVSQAEQGMGHSEWPMTQVTHWALDPWPMWPMTHGSLVPSPHTSTSLTQIHRLPGTVFEHFICTHTFK